VSSKTDYDLRQVSILGRRNSESIIFRTGSNSNNNIGWLLKTPDESTSSIKIGAYSPTWVTSFNEEINFLDLDEKMQKLLIHIINDNFGLFDNTKIKLKLGITVEDAKVSIFGNVIDIENLISFDISDVKLIKYSSNKIQLVFKDSLEESIPNLENISKIIKEAFIKIKKIYI